jgi:hypothetical protein
MPEVAVAFFPWVTSAYVDTGPGSTSGTLTGPVVELGVAFAWKP